MCMEDLLTKNGAEKFTAFQFYAKFTTYYFCAKLPLYRRTLLPPEV